MYGLFLLGLNVLISSVGCMTITDISPAKTIDLDNANIAAYKYANNPCAEIRNGQFICTDCATLAFCIQQGGEWLTLEYDTCRTDKSMYCDENARGCTRQRECRVSSRGPRFECQNSGMYPDPYDCMAYHICNDLNEDTRRVCPAGRIYSVAAKECIPKAANKNFCNTLPYNCDNYGSMGAWTGDANIYYVCHAKAMGAELVYYPLLYRCQAGSIFDGQQCRVSADKPNDSSTLSSTNSKSDSTTEMDGSVAERDCAEGAFLANGNDCRAYYICSKGIRVAYRCPKGTIYHAERGYCTLGKC